MRCLVATQSCLLSVLIQGLQGVHVDVCKHDQVGRTRVVVCVVAWSEWVERIFLFSFLFYLYILRITDISLLTQFFVIFCPFFSFSNFFVANLHFPYW
jgi:hypothetical protein